MSDEGSPAGNLALMKLAADLHIEANALKSALEEAFDMAQQNGNPSFSLHMVLARMGYQQLGQVFYSRLSDFRRDFRAMLSGEEAPYTRFHTPQMRANPYRTVEALPEARIHASPQYTSTAMPWSSENSGHNNLAQGRSTMANSHHNAPSMVPRLDESGDLMNLDGGNNSTRQPAASGTSSHYPQIKDEHQGMLPPPLHPGESHVGSPSPEIFDAQK